MAGLDELSVRAERTGNRLAIVVVQLELGLVRRVRRRLLLVVLAAKPAGIGARVVGRGVVAEDAVAGFLVDGPQHHAALHHRIVKSGIIPKAVESAGAGHQPREVGQCADHLEALGVVGLDARAPGHVRIVEPARDLDDVAARARDDGTARRQPQVVERARSDLALGHAPRDVELDMLRGKLDPILGHPAEGGEDLGGTRRRHRAVAV